MRKHIVTLFILIAVCLVPASVCAQPVQSRIVGGEEATPGDWPWMVALINSGQGSDALNGQFCGGALINERWVLSAAHCFEGKSASDVEVVIGRHDLTSTDGEVIGVSRIINHENYNTTTNENDIALLELSSASSAQTISLATPSIIDNFGTGESLTVTGWGNMSATGQSFPERLQQVSVPVFDQSSCNDVYGGIVDSMICAGFAEGGKDSCQGDSGGPLMGQTGGTWYHVGVVSFGNGCAQANSPGVYSRTSEFNTWISDNTNIGICTEGLTVDAAPSISGTDTDGDGVTDTQETTDGSDPNDPGSYRTTLASTVFSLWTGFLDINNILELVNVGSSNLNATVKFYKIDGTVCSSVNVTLTPGQQQDLLINNMAGYEQNTFGVLSITWSGGQLDGRTSYYRNASTSTTGVGDYSFAYSIPLANPLFGESVVSFNSNQPSLASADASNLVANWLTIVNLASTTSSYTIRSYNLQGELISTRSSTVAALGRVDLEAGHEDPGPGNVGKHVVTPSDTSKPYIALITRYGYNVPASQLPTDYSFAFPLIAKAGSGQSLNVPLTTTINAQSWLEVINTRSSQSSVAVDFYNSGGTLLETSNNSIPADSQVHLNVNSRIGDAATGYAIIRPASSNSIVAQAMVYSRNPSTGGIMTMYGSQARESFDSTIVGTYNLFLNMNSWMRLMNPGNSSVDVDITVSLSSGSSSTSLTLAPHASTDVGIHDSNTFNTVENTYGIVTVEVDNSQEIYSELLRLRTDSATGLPDFAAVTEVR